MTPRVTWVEKGSDGRHYYVRKKSRTPSARKLLSDILAPLRKSSSPFSRAYQRDHHIVPASFNNPLYLPAPPIPPTSWAPTITVPPNHQPPSGPYARAMDYTQSYDHSPGNGDPNSDNPRGIMKPQPRSFPVPHPTMYPAAPQSTMPAQQQPSFGPLPLQNQLPNQMRHVPTQPPGAYPSQPLPHGARIISPPRYPTADELRYKCSSCGRFRSARYHYKHPLPPGQLPGKTVCRKCREEATDSEESTASSDNRYDRRRYRQRSRSRSRAASRGAISRRARSRRGRSLGREEWSEDEYEDDLRDRRWSYSRSSSLDLEPLRSRSRRSRPPRFPSVEVIRYIERAPQRRPARRVIYVENERPRRDEEYFWDETRRDFEYRPSHRVRGLSRPPTPAPRAVWYRVSDPAMRTPLAIEHRGYFDDQDSSFDGYESTARPSSRAVSRSRIVSAPYRRSQRQGYVSESDEGFDDGARRSSYRRPRSLMGRGCSASRSHSEGRRVYADRGDHRNASRLPRVPSPPGWDDRAGQAAIESARARNSFGEYSEQARRRSRSRARSHSRSHSVEPARLTPGFLRPGEDATVVERHGSDSTQEYDWYDKDGMRVRVREI